MVIMYKMNAVTAFFAKRLVRHSKYFGMVNLILGGEAVPERFQEQASVNNLCELLQSYIDEPELRQQTADKLAHVRERLGDLGATERVAQSLEEYFT